MSKPILIVQGGCWGSEAKGAIASYLCNTRNVNYAVRTGASNAGHSAMYRGRKVVCQSIPVGFTNPNTALVIGAGALIDPELLVREADMLSEVTGTDIRDRLFIDPRAGIHLSAHQDLSKSSGRHHAIGATGKGCSEALVSRIKNRGGEPMLFGRVEQSQGFQLRDTEALLNDAYDQGAQLLLEGTQGQLLDLYLGPYPYVTHKQTGPAQWMLEAGLSPSLKTEIVAVVRTFPIRVAGNSGPMPQETSWPIFARNVNYKRESYGLPPVVQEESIAAFEMALKVVSKSGQFRMPEFSEGLDQHTWADRSLYREALSELNTAAWHMLPTPIQADLSNLFELTTVTKKLRRIAHLDIPTLQTSARQMRPDWVALTFFNYMSPDWWYEAPSDYKDFETPFVQSVEGACRAPVKMLTYGPADEHILAL